MIRALILDADGVLIHGERFSKQLTLEYGISLEAIEPFFEGPFQKCLFGEGDLREEIVPYLSQWGWTQGADAFLDFWFSAEHKMDEELIAYVQTLRQRGITCVVATNQEKQRADYMLQKMGFADSFDGLYASAHFGHAKPSEQFYAKLMLAMAPLEKKDALFWDDSPANVAGAKEFGMHAELYTSLEEFKKKMAQYLS